MWKLIFALGLIVCVESTYIALSEGPRRELSWYRASKQNDLGFMGEYLSAFPDGRHAQAIVNRLCDTSPENYGSNVDLKVIEAGLERYVQVVPRDGPAKAQLPLVRGERQLQSQDAAGLEETLASLGSSSGKSLRQRGAKLLENYSFEQALSALHNGDGSKLFSHLTGQHAKEAYTALIEWVGKPEGLYAAKKYIHQYSNSTNASAVHSLIDDCHFNQALSAKDQGDASELYSYLQSYPEGRHVKEAHNALFQWISNHGDLAEARQYLKQFPYGPYIWDVQSLLDHRTYAKAVLALAYEHVEPLHQYLKEYPKGHHAQEALAALQLRAFKPKSSVSHQNQKRETFPTTVGQVLINSIGMKLTYIPAGEFMMGSPSNEANRMSDETQHRVRISQPFLMQTTEVTQSQWQSVMGNNPSVFKGDSNLPVEKVSWSDAVAFCEKLSQRDGRTYRLPTEAQWEYACRAGTTTPFSFGHTLSTNQANYNGNFVYGSGVKGTYRGKTVAVGSFPANAWGLYDMHGNVWEWCSDWYGDYPSGNVTDPTGASDGSARVCRGGSWDINPGFCRSAVRLWINPPSSSYIIGFRVSCSVSLGPGPSD